MNNNESKQQPSDRKVAIQKTFNGLKEKMPIFVFAAIAVIGLSVLDRSKVSYQTAKNSPLEVNDRFVRAVKPGVWMEWLNNPYYVRYHRFANTGELLDTLASRAIAQNAAQQTRLDATRRQSVDKFEHDRAEFTAAIAKAQEKRNDVDKQKETLGNGSPRVKDSQLSKLGQEGEDANNAIETNKAKLQKAEEEDRFNRDEYDARTRTLSEDSRQKIDSIYNDLGPVLPSVVLSVQDKPQGLSDNLLRPILDDQSSLYVIYQILRTTALVVVVLSFVFVLAMVLRQVPLTNGSDTLADQLRGLIKGGGGEVARAAVLGVAAVGVGTAAVVAGNSINDKADRALEMATASAVSSVSINPLMREAYYRNNAYGWNRTLNSTSSSITNIDGTETPPVFSPTNNITLPEPVVRIVQVSDRAGTHAIVSQLNAIGSRLPLTDVTALKDSVLKVQEDISLIKSGLGSFKSEASSANVTLGRIDSSLQQFSAAEVSSASAQQLLMTGTNSKLELIDTNIAGMRRESLAMFPRSDGRNFGTRAGQFFGSESFAISEQSYEGIKSQLPKTLDYAAILVALERLKYQLPVGKGTFLKGLREETAKAALTAKSPVNGKELLKLLKSWESVILSYARLPR